MTGPLRALTPTDAPALAATHAQCFEAPWAERDFAGWLARPDVIGVGVAPGGHLCGFGLLLVAVDEADLVTLAVAPSARGQGWGGRVLAALEEQATARGVARVVLEVAVDNHPARAVYARAGYTQQGLRRGYYPRVGGAPVDALLLARHLEPV
jgi:ribosomal-protein-alanine N-acetyltransferase